MKNKIIALYAWILIQILMLFVGFETRAQSLIEHTEYTKYLNAQRYDIYDGIAGNSIPRITQDQNGYMWFATYSGLSRFDSRQFKNYQQDTLATNSLPSNDISIFHQVRDEIWLSLDIGLAKYNTKTEAFSMLPIGEGISDGIEHSLVFAISSDQNDNVWVFQFDHGISVYERARDSFTHYNQKNTDWLSTVRFYDAKSDGQYIWVATLEGQVLRIDPKTRTMKSYLVSFDAEDYKQGMLYSIAIAANGSVFVSGYTGVYQLNNKTDSFEMVVSPSAITTVMGERLTVRSLMSDSRGYLWLATLEGLMLYKEGLLYQVRFLDKGRPSLFDINIHYVFEDREHNVWVGTNDHGVIRINNQWDEVNILLPFVENTAFGNEIKSVLVDQSKAEDTFWFLNEKQQSLTVYRYQKGVLKLSQIYDQTHGLPDVVKGLFLDSEYRLWLNAVNGLHVYDNQLNQFVLLESEFNTVGSAKIFETAANIYFSTYGNNQLYQVDKFNLTITAPPSLMMMNNVLYGHLLDEQGRHVLFGDKGMELFDEASQNLAIKMSFDEGISDMVMMPDKEQIWLLSNGKLLLYHTVESNFILQNTAKANVNISKYFSDRISLIDDQLWLSSDNGVVVIEPKNQSIIKSFTVESQLPSNAIRKVVQLYDGTVMIVTAFGLVQVSENNQQFAQNQAAVLVVDSILLNDKAYDLSIPLAYDYGSLTFNYQLLSFASPKSHQYQYRYRAADEWIDTHQQTSQSFHQLSPGNYQFEVRGKAQNSDWSVPVSYAFNVTAPPWKSHSAYYLYGLIGMCFIGLLFYLYRKRWQYNASITQAKEKQAFAETQLTLTTSLVSSLATDELLEKIKQEIKNKIKADQIEVSYWNSENNYQIFSDSSLDKVQQNELGAKALQMYEQQQNHLIESLSVGSNLWVLFSHSANRLGLVRLYRQHGSFNQSDISLAKAYATQSSLALENARLFEEVNHLAEQANASNKAKSDFLAQVSHEVRTPMNGILGMNELLLDTQLTEEQRVYASAVAESGEHLLHIINDILDLSKIEAGELVLEHRPVNLLAILDEVIKSFGSVSKNKKLLFWTNFSTELEPLRMADSVRLKQILMNLLSNAFKFTAKGEVSVCINASTETNVVKMAVKDSGIGIEADMLDKLFEPFTQADSSITRKYGGTGLGLSIVKQLTEKMGGYLEIQSEPNQGTEVSCFIPLELTGLSYEIKQKSNSVRLLGRHENIKQGLQNCLHFNGIQSTQDETQLSDALFIVDDKSADYSVEIAEANRNLVPVYLLKAPHHHSEQRGTFKVFDLPFTYSGINQLFSTKASEMYGESKPIKNHKKMHLLVVEDNPINQQLLLELLEKEGHMVDIFDDANHALAGIETSNYDLLLVDYHLPDLTGIEFINACRALKIKTKTVIMTADVSNELKQLCESSDVDYLITKPFKMAELTQIINDN